MKLLLIFCCLVVLTDMAMNTMPGLMRHPYWKDAVYRVYAQACFANIGDLDKKDDVKSYLMRKADLWNIAINLQSPVICYEEKELSKEEMLTKALELFYVNWDNASLFIKTPLTAKGHKNTAALRAFFKEFTATINHLYFEANKAIMGVLQENNHLAAEQQTEVLIKLYPSPEDRDKSKLKEGQRLLEAVLQCFDAS